MLLLDCPWCGARDEVEFHFGGEADLRYPLNPELLDDAEWGAYLYVHDNVAGDRDERWCHSAGCGRWFTAVRDTRTQRFGATHPIASGAAHALAH
jgi:heterotetrameric sarcosine oxidase delta subunit